MYYRRQQMIREMTLGQYYKADSILHKLDPRVKLLGTLLFVITLFLTFLTNQNYHSDEDDNYQYQVNNIIHIALDQHIQSGENSENE